MDNHFSQASEYSMAHCWIEINLDHLLQNYKSVRNFVHDDVKIMGIVKADAYGHGAYPVASQLIDHGVDYIGVSLPEEAIRLRNDGIRKPILVLSPALEEWYPFYIKYQITPNITSCKDAEKLGILAKDGDHPFPIHVEVDTGMGRYGLDAGTAAETIVKIASIDSLRVEGVFTHFAAAGGNPSLTMKQITAFNTVLDKIKSEIEMPMIHAANSAAVVKYPQAHYNMVRVGSLFYGQDITGSNTLKLYPTWSMKSKLLQVRDLPTGTNIGYGDDVRLKRKARVGVIPVGFTDGLLVRTIERPYTFREALRLAFRNFAFYFGMERVQEYVSFRNKKAPVLGRVGMQHVCIDLSGFDSPKAGEIVSMLARKAGINPTIPKIYIWKNQLFTTDANRVELFPEENSVREPGNQTGNEEGLHSDDSDGKSDRKDS